MKTKGSQSLNATSRRGFWDWLPFLLSPLQPCILSEAPTTKAAGGDVNPGTVDARLEEQTRRLKAAIEIEGLPPSAEVLEVSGEVGPSFNELVKTPTVGFRKVQVTEAMADLGCGWHALTAGVFNVPTLPGPPQVFVETHFDAISVADLGLSSDEESMLESRLGVTGSPSDIVWNTVGFQIPWDEMDAAMRDVPGDDREMPESWYLAKLMSWILWSNVSNASMRVVLGCCPKNHAGTKITS